jgi:hypothetical protein
VRLNRAWGQTEQCARKKLSSGLESIISSAASTQPSCHGSRVAGSPVEIIRTHYRSTRDFGFPALKPCHSDARAKRGRRNLLFFSPVARTRQGRGSPMGNVPPVPIYSISSSREVKEIRQKQPIPISLPRIDASDLDAVYVQKLAAEVAVGGKITQHSSVPGRR